MTQVRYLRMNYKLKFIFKPFLVAYSGFLAGYTFLNKILFAEPAFYPVPEAALTFWLPLCLSAVIYFLFVYPRLQILRLNGSAGSLVHLYNVVLLLVFFVPCLLAQLYIAKAGARMTRLASVTEIKERRNSRYYQLDNYFADKRTPGVYMSDGGGLMTISPQKYEIFVAVPLFNKEQDAARRTPEAWLGLSYQQDVSHDLNQQEKKRLLGKFLKNSYKLFRKSDLANFSYFDRLPNSRTRDNYIYAIKNNRRYKSADLILTPSYQAFEQRNGQELVWLIWSMILGVLLVLLMVILPDVSV